MRKLLQDLLHKEQRYLNFFFSHLDLHRAEEVVKTCLDCQGVLLFSGVGKSGLIAKKIAVTMISTGTRAIYLSPTNAVHGDLGIVTKDDIFFVLSKSGESDELLQLIPFVRNKGARVIALVCDQNSRLEKASDYTLILPFQKELCPYDMAPTVSTTIQMLFGDLLAIALMQKKKFPLDQYALNHPAGQIGRRLSLRVEDLMLKEEKIPTTSPEKRLFEVLVELSTKQCGCVLVVNQNEELLGIFTDGDLRRSIQQGGSDALQSPVVELMTKTPRWVCPEEFATSALSMMEGDQKHPIMVLPVLNEEKRVVGLIKMHDILQTGL